MSDETAEAGRTQEKEQQGKGQEEGAPRAEVPPARRRRTVRRRGGYMAKGSLATDLPAPPPSMTITDSPAVPAPAAQDGTDDQGADE
ncbi:hypothetical protein [Streptomyces sp. NPDC051665]|uniref:hypothetical protein n=1 Tax=Streptomyces sp. NPDC051665 TaxID=3154647 RepID=UPI00342814E9